MRACALGQFVLRASWPAVAALLAAAVAAADADERAEANVDAPAHTRAKADAHAEADADVDAQVPATGPRIEALRVGFAGRYKIGAWTPVAVVLRAGERPVSGRLRLSVPDGDGVASRVSVGPESGDGLVHLLPGRPTEVHACVRFGRVCGWLLVEFLPEGGPPVRRRFTAGKGPRADFARAVEFSSLIVVLGEDDEWAADAVRTRASRSGPQPVVVCLNDAGQLPDRWYAYEGVDVLAVATSRPEVFRAEQPGNRTDGSPAPGSNAAEGNRNPDPSAQMLSPDDPRLEALAQWVRLGGRLLILAGAQTPAVLTGEGPLAGFAPGELEEMAVLRETAPLETYCASVRPVPRGSGPLALPVARWRRLDGRVEAASLGLPLVVRSAQGFGEVTLVAADLDREPWASWSDRGLLVARLLDLPEPTEEPLDETSALMHFGYQNMAGQLRSALDRFAGVSAVPFAVVALLLVVYVLLLGPVDYFLLRKFARRMEWTWLTFPLLVAVVCAGVWGLACWLKGRQLRVHQAEVIDVDTSSGLVRGTAWAGVFCPKSARYDFALRPVWPNVEADKLEVLTAWHGLPGSALGGMNPPAGEFPLWSETYDFSPRLDALQGVPVAVWSTKSLTARWSGTTQTFPAARLVEENDMLEGTITNALPCPLKDCVLAYGQEAYELGDLKSGASASVQLTTPRMSLRTWLTGIRMVTGGMEDAQQEATPYDQSNRDPAYILRVMLFFRAAGGRAYAGLGNDDHRFVDLSALLPAGRAVMFARLPEPSAESACGSRWLCNGREPGAHFEQRSVWLRFVFPVQVRE